jgi:hypothetical protein
MSKRISSVRLAGWFALLAILTAALSVTAYALTRGGGPTPPNRSLAAAIRSTLLGKPVRGLSARFTISQHLLPGGSSLLSNSTISGASGQVWASGGRVRLQLRSRLGPIDLGFDGSRVTFWDHRHRVAYVLDLPSHAKAGKDATDRHHGLPSLAHIQTLLGRLAREAFVSGAAPGTIAGRPAYTVRVSPREDPGLIGAAELAWDSQHGTPLRFAIYPLGSDTPAIEITVTDIRYGAVPARSLAVTPTPGTHVVQVHPPSRGRHGSSAHEASPTSTVGLAAVTRSVDFRLAAPASVAGMERTAVRSVSMGRRQAALVVYGHGLGSVFVLEQRAVAKDSALSALPSATVNGAPGRELETTLGTLLRFTSGGVTYTVIGSRPASTIMSVAGSLR